MDRSRNNRSIYICYNNSNSSSSSKVRRWNNSNGNNVDDGDGLMKMKMMTSWPPRCYTCSFCKREFRSAQALGGHMNVHRRDRAHLKQLSSVISSTSTNTFTHLLPNTTTTSSSTINLNFPPLNPNHMLLSPPTPSPPPPPTFQSPTTCTSSDDVINNLVRTTTSADNRQPKLSELGFKRNDHYSSDDHSFNNSTTDGFLRLDLEMNIHPQDLDLELRLGYN